MGRIILIGSLVVVGVIASALWARARSQQTTEQKQTGQKSSAAEQESKQMPAKETTTKQPERIEAADLKKKLDSGEKMLLIDVREDWELKADGAIPGAIHIPVGELDARMKDIPKDVQLVFY